MCMEGYSSPGELCVGQKKGVNCQLRVMVLYDIYTSARLSLRQTLQLFQHQATIYPIPECSNRRERNIEHDGGIITMHAHTVDFLVITHPACLWRVLKRSIRGTAGCWLGLLWDTFHHATVHCSLLFAVLVPLAYGFLQLSMYRLGNKQTTK